MTCACGGPAAIDGGADAGPDAATGAPTCPADPGPGDAGASGATNRCVEALVWQGFAARWAQGPHPLALLDTALRTTNGAPVGCAPAASLRAAELVTGLSGGAETTGPLGSDTFRASVSYAVVQLGADAPVRSVHGETAVELERAEEGSALALVDLAAASLDAAPALAVVLDGIELTTDVAQRLDYPPGHEPADGYASRGIGAWIAGVTRTGDDLRIELGARMALGRGLDAAATRAVPFATTRVTVRFAVLAVAVEPSTSNVAYRIDSQPVADPSRTVCRPGAEADVAVSGMAGLPRGTLGLTSFRLTILPDEAPDGVEVRELAARLLDVAYDPATGRASARMEGYATNEVAPRAMSYALEAEVALLQWEGTGAVDALRFDVPDLPAGRDRRPAPLAP